MNMNLFYPFTKSRLPVYPFILLMALLFSLPAIDAEAKWWIFGKGDDAEVSTRYIYINNHSYDELGDKVTLYHASLPQGKITIRGKGSAGKKRIGAVQISLDGKQSWQKADLTSDGSFVYSFTPEVDQNYQLYVKVLDTTGKSNDVESSRKELTISADNPLDAVYLALDQLVKAYMDEDSFTFMRQVSDTFVSGTALLDSAIRQDFSAFDNIQLDYTLNNVTQASDGKLFVAISFTRMVTSSRSGDTFNDRASTEFTFKLENGVPKIYSMKNPLIFGLSDAANMATGTVNTGENSNLLFVDSAGTVGLASLADIAAGGTATNHSATVESGSFSLIWENDGTPRQAFRFASQSVVNIWETNDLNTEINLIFLNSGTTAYEIGSVSLESISTVSNVPGDYILTDFASEGNVGRAFALRLGNGNFAVIRITGFTWIDPMAPDTRVDMEYKYQLNGSPHF